MPLSALLGTRGPRATSLVCLGPEAELSIKADLITGARIALPSLLFFLPLPINLSTSRASEQEFYYSEVLCINVARSVGPWNLDPTFRSFQTRFPTKYLLSPGPSFSSTNS